jgi:phage replication O-like protein O
MGPQLEDGYTRIANDILDALSKMKLSGREFRVCLALIRKTYGWGKKEDEISLSQFADATGISRNHIQEILSDLTDRKIVTRKRVKGRTVPKDGNSDVPENRNRLSITWGFQKRSELWIKGKPQKRNHSGVPENGNKSVPENGNNKRKERKYKDKAKALPYEKEIFQLEFSEVAKTKSDHQRFVDYYCAHFLQKCENKYPFSNKKDGAITKRLLKAHGAEILAGYAKTFFTEPDDFTEKAGYSMAVFESQLAKLAGGQYGTSKSKAPTGPKPNRGKWDGR